MPPSQTSGTPFASRSRKRDTERTIKAGCRVADRSDELLSAPRD
jgi:hypothetical protein